MEQLGIIDWYFVNVYFISRALIDILYQQIWIVFVLVDCTVEVHVYNQL